MINSIKSEIKDLVCRIVDKLGEQVYGVLHMGSSASLKPGYKDVDLIVILKNNETTLDLAAIKKIMSNFPFLFDLHVISLQTIKDGLDYSLYTQGQFFIEYLKRAELCYGINPFKGIIIPDEIIKISIKQKLQYFYSRAQMYFLNDKYGDNFLNYEEFSFHKKKILLMLVDYWLAFSGELKNIDDCDFDKVLKSLELHDIYIKDIIFIKSNDYVQYTFVELINIYNKIYFSAISKIDNLESS